MTVDYKKAQRQLGIAKATSRNQLRIELCTLMIMVYIGLGRRDVHGAGLILDKFNAMARDLGWRGGAARLPRPFSHRHLELLYWQASKLLGKGGQPRRGGERELDYADLHLLSRLGKPKRKPYAQGG